MDFIKKRRYTHELMKEKRKNDKRVRFFGREGTHNINIYCLSCPPHKTLIGIGMRNSERGAWGRILSHADETHGGRIQNTIIYRYDSRSPEEIIKFEQSTLPGLRNPKTRKK
ncbi:MAG: hypothetical protein UT63_C0004G0019 [Candidatus Gottesmanbacteria bacterium GW2011_GWC2_39_8]|uniref:Uncharacterized protein n=1 Tax=Candidatus Gottesmanbacteria bacterium GW2011_GWC2_39_8 TaxID=1618450 RepID=A0A0G0T8P2_9BACT|nr:MAG: hypothetical protein UT63_C0004G0019 [Candidatus Gottesmanbacteria bacterium GW2011_GWC2_39_8]